MAACRRYIAYVLDLFNRLIRNAILSVSRTVATRKQPPFAPESANIGT